MYNHLGLTEVCLVPLGLQLQPVHPVTILPRPVSVSGVPGLWNILRLKIISNISF